MNRRKTVAKEAVVDVEDQINQKEQMFAPVIQVYRDNLNLTDIQVDSITSIMQNIEIFKTWCPESSTLFEFTRLICQNLQYERIQKENAVFHIGEQGDKFYIILTGRAGVYIRRQQQQIEAEESAMIPKIEKILERLQIKTIEEIEQDQKLSFYEKLIKKQSKPVKQIEAELLLLYVGNFDMYFTINGICKFQQLSQVHSGLYFGDMALTTDKPRAASIIAVTDVQALSLNKANFKKIFEKQIKTQQEKIDYFLKMFPTMTKFKMSKLIMYFTQYKYPVNYTIWKQNDIVDGFFLLKDGEIQLQQTVDFNPLLKSEQNQIILSPKKEKSNQKELLTIAHLTGGCFVGETDIYLQNERRDYTVKTITQCNVFVLQLDNYAIVKKSFPEFIIPLQSLQQKNIALYRKRLADIVQTKISNTNLNKKEEVKNIERRYINEIEIKQKTQNSVQEQSSPILRSTLQPKMTKQQMVEQNLSIADQHTKSDIATGKNEEFNMLKMAGENFQKCLIIRVEKQFEQFQPTKPKSKTPYFSKHQKDIKDLLEQIRRHQLPSVQLKEPIVFNQQQEEDLQNNNLPFLTMTKQQLRIINPLIQQKVEILKQCLSRQSHTSISKSKSLCQTADQFYKAKAQQGFILCDTLFPYKPVHSTKNSNNQHYSNFKVVQRNKTTQQSQIQKRSCQDITDTNFFSSQPTVQFT
ncbi:unnamed protein product [Paramecium octaurelia]|uniref:Cyclic nucleotide-binding domain-containing protein n=1 Tax=Paramecium octaurelia TaxID=43137 RepID=A0A8S1WRL9_PAROT|nr:unnamed protein product [Paramecium octaurelia]